MLLASYDYSLEYVKGSENCVADCLSRLPKPLSQEEEVDLIHAMNEFTRDPCDDIPLSAEDVAKATSDDQVLSSVVRFLRSGWPTMVPEDFVPYHRISHDVSRTWMYFVEESCCDSAGVSSFFATGAAFCSCRRYSNESHCKVIFLVA